MKGAKKFLAFVAIVVAVGGIIIYALFFYKNGIFATLMRLEEYQGNIMVKDEDEKVNARTGMKLYNGYKVGTAKESLAYISLDENMLLKMDSQSQIQVNKSGEKLELSVNKGAVFFNVKQPLDDDEEFNIKTATMALGVRGTSGLVYAEGERTIVQIYDGKVTLEPTEDSSQAVTATAGNAVSVTVNETGNVIVEEVQIEQNGKDIPDFVLDEIIKDETLADRIKDDSSLNVDNFKEVHQDEANSASVLKTGFKYNIESLDIAEITENQLFKKLVGVILKQIEQYGYVVTVDEAMSYIKEYAYLFDTDKLVAIINEYSKFVSIDQIMAIANGDISQLVFLNEEFIEQFKQFEGFEGMEDLGKIELDNIQNTKRDWNGVYSSLEGINLVIIDSGQKLCLADQTGNKYYAEVLSENIQDNHIVTKIFMQELGYELEFDITWSENTLVLVGTNGTKVVLNLTFERTAEDAIEKYNLYKGE